MDAIEYSSTVKVEKVGDSNPVGDFEAMISRRDSPEWVSKGIQSMKDKIFNLVEQSFEGDNYQRALECLVALRKGCILEQVYMIPLLCVYVDLSLSLKNSFPLIQEPKQFNEFFRHLHKFCQEKKLESFSEYLASQEMMLISKTEAPERFDLIIIVVFVYSFIVIPILFLPNKWLFCDGLLHAVTSRSMKPSS